MELKMSQVIEDIEARSNNPLDRVGHAVQAGRELEKIADAVVDHFVNEARRAGCSWAQIGGALNISKQAAQQRFGGSPQSFEQFSDDAKRALTRAPALAQARGHSYVATEHLLDALMEERKSRAARVMSALGVKHDAVRAQLYAVDRSDLKGVPSIPGEPPLPTQKVKKVIEQSFQEARELGAEKVDTEHFLLAMVKHGPAAGVAGAALANLGVTEKAVREKLGELR
jgi:hypothetical protein